MRPAFRCSDWDRAAELVNLSDHEFALRTSEALATIIRITNGNFRLTARLIAQIKRVLDINQLTVVTKEVIEAARESLVIGVL